MTDHTDVHAEIADFQTALASARTAIAAAIVGQEQVVEGVLAALIAGGHVLLEGLPGLGKTELVKALAAACDLRFRRLQFTPDLMPADIIGTHIMVQDATGGWHVEFRPGPVFTQLLLADEINRATPKTQSALLETMQEGTVTVAGGTHVLEPPFLVLATQNPIEQEGTYPLPEAQLDRFLLKLAVPFPSRTELAEIADRTALRAPTAVPRVLDASRLADLRHTLERVVVAPGVRDYAVSLVMATHPDANTAPQAVREAVRWGASPRAVQALLRCARVRALACGRAHVACADVRHFAPAVLGHRIILSYDGQAEGIRVADLVIRICAEVPEA